MVNHAAISFKGTSVGYHHTHGTEVVLKGLDLSFSHGEFIGVVGLNGSGKSTLLRSIAGLLPVLKGELLVEGRSLNAYDTLGLSRKVSIVLTERVGGFNLRLEDVVATGQMPYTDAFHRLREEHLAVIDKAIERCGVGSYRHKDVTQLSDGMFQKAMIARSLAQQTPVLLMDEPSAFLDYASKHSLFRLLRELGENEQKCVLVSSHDLDLLLKYCHRILIIHDGLARLCGVDDARQDAAFTELTGGFL